MLSAGSLRPNVRRTREQQSRAFLRVLLVSFSCRAISVRHRGAGAVGDTLALVPAVYLTYGTYMQHSPMSMYVLVEARMGLTHALAERKLLLFSHCYTHALNPIQPSLASNVKPVREFLRNTNGGTHHTLTSWIFSKRRGDQKGNTSRVACSSAAGTTRSATMGRSGGFDRHFNEGRLAIIMGFLPLKEAFREYCQRGLCSEVRIMHRRVCGCAYLRSNLERISLTPRSDVLSWP